MILFCKRIVSSLRETIAKNSSMYQELQKTQQLLALAAQALAEKGDPRIMQALAGEQPQEAPIVRGVNTQKQEIGHFGEVLESDTTQAGKAKKQSRESTEVK